MARVSSIVTNFQAGELSPRLEGRIDLQKYSAGAQTLQNMVVFPQGGVTRRPGTQYAGTSKDGGKVRLINFEFSDEQAYVLEFGENYIRFFVGGGLLTSNSRNITNVTISTSGRLHTASSEHGIKTDDRILVSGIEGTTELNNREFVASESGNYTISGVSGTFSAGETITGSTTSSTAIVISATASAIVVRDIKAGSGTLLGQDDFFKGGAGETITGSTSGATATLFGASKSIDSYFFIKDSDGNLIDTSGFTAYSSGGTFSDIVEVATSYTAEQVFEINHAQSADVLYLAHKNHPPAKLIRTTATSFTLSDIDFNDGPYLDENITDVTIYATGDTGTVNLIATAGDEVFRAATAENPDETLRTSSGIFSSDNIGQLWRFREVVEEHHDQWEADTAYANGASIYYNGNVYEQTIGSTQNSGNSPPVHLSGAVSYNSGVIEWTYQHSGTGYVQITEINKEVPVKLQQGTFQLGESVVGDSSGASGTYVGEIVYPTDPFPSLVGDSIVLFLSDVTGTFVDNERIEGQTSTADGVILHSLIDSPASVKATVKNETGVLPDHVVGSDDATTKWSEGAFSIGNGYPRAVAFYEERLFFAGTTAQPQTIFGSVTADFENHEPGTEDDKAINITIASDQVNVIKHMIPGRFLQIMTTSAEFTLSGGTGTTAVTPTNVNVLRETTFGSGDVRPLRAGASTIMIQKGGEKVKEVTFSLDTDGLVGRDLTVLGEHLARGGLTDMVWQQEPELILWFVRGDGTLIGLSYDPANNTIGWHQHPLGGSGVVESITAIPSGTEDQVYMSVKRTINSETVRHIVFMKPIYFDEEITSAFFVDSGLTYTGTASTASSTLSFPGILANTTSLSVADGSAFPSTGVLRIDDELISYASSGANNFDSLTRGAFGTVAAAHSTGATVTDVTYENTNTVITGLNHLEGETVQILADGAAHADKTVSGGSITLDTSAIKVHIGYSYDSLVETLRMEAGAEDGVAQGKIKRIHGVTIRFLDTVGADIGPDTSNLKTIPFRDSSMAMDQAIPLFSGDKEVVLHSGYDKDAKIVVKQGQPLPMSIIAIMRRSNTFDA